MSYGDWKPYVSVAQRQAKAEKAIAKAQKTGARLSPVAAFRGAIAKTFWGKAWCDNLENYSDYANRLPRGSSYVRHGAVIDLQITPGQVHAQVMGSSLYTLSANINPLADKSWKSVCTDCSASIDSLVELLQGKLSSAVMERICTPGSGLFPTPSEISFRCSCPDWASMCKHVAAVLYGIGARLDQQPELLFSLRGVNAKDLIKHAGAGLPQSPKRPVSSKVLDPALLADVFGLEMANVPVQEPQPRRDRAPAVKTAKKASLKPVAEKTAKSKATAAPVIVTLPPAGKKVVSKTPLKPAKSLSEPARPAAPTKALAGKTKPPVAEAKPLNPPSAVKRTGVRKSKDLPGQA